MPINLNDNIYIKAGKPSEAKFLSPSVQAYTSVAQVNALIPISERYPYLIVVINGLEYWYAGDVTDGDLIPKNVPSTWGLVEGNILDQTDLTQYIENELLALRPLTTNLLRSEQLNFNYREGEKIEITFPTGVDLIHGFTFAKGSLFASTRTNPAQVVKINPETLAYQTLTSPSGTNPTYGTLEQIVYVPSKEKLYGVHQSVATRIVISEIDPITFDRITICDLSSGSISSMLSPTLTADENYLYIISYTLGTKLHRIDLATFSVLTVLDLGISTTTQTRAHNILIDKESIYISSGYANGTRDTYVIRVNKSTFTLSQIVSVSNKVGFTDDGVVNADHLYLVPEIAVVGTLSDVANDNDLGYIYRYDKKNLSILTKIDTGVRQTAYGVFYDSQNCLWIAYSGLSIANPTVPTTGILVKYNLNLNTLEYFTLPVGSEAPNEIFIDEVGRLFVTCFQAPAKLIRYQINALSPYKIRESVVREYATDNSAFFAANPRSIPDIAYIQSLISAGANIWGTLTGDINAQTDLINYITSRLGFTRGTATITGTALQWTTFDFPTVTLGNNFTINNLSELTVGARLYKFVGNYSVTLNSTYFPNVIGQYVQGVDNYLHVFCRLETGTPELICTWGRANYVTLADLSLQRGNGSLNAGVLDWSVYDFPDISLSADASINSIINLEKGFRYYRITGNGYEVTLNSSYFSHIEGEYLASSARNYLYLVCREEDSGEIEVIAEWTYKPGSGGGGTGNAIKLTLENPELTSTANECIWTIDNTLFDDTAHVRIFNKGLGQELWMYPTITETSITYTFASSTTITAGTFKVSIIGTQYNDPGDGSSNSLPYTLPYTLGSGSGSINSLPYNLPINF